jgi:hypothetical protein
MSDLKHLAFALIEACEKTYVERTILESLLVGSGVHGWREMYERLLADSETRRHIHASFQPLYDLAESESGAERALQELLRVLPKSGKVN